MEQNDFGGAMAELNESQKELLNRFNNTRIDFQISGSLCGLFEEQCHKTPDAIAVEHEGSSLTYSALNSKSNQIANWLVGNGTRPGSFVGLCVERSIDMVVAILGIIKSGSAYVPFDPSYPADRIQYMIRESGVQTLLIHESNRELFSGMKVQLKSIDSEQETFNKESDKDPGIITDATSPAYVLFTSGSTGMPKGVVMVHRALANLVAWQKNQTSLGTAARTLQFAPVSFDVSFQELFTTWTTSGTLVLISDEMRLNAIRLLEFINENKIERLFLPFIALQHLCEVAVNSKIWPGSLKDIITAGEQLRTTRHIVEFFNHVPGCRLHNHYGPTETHVVTSYILEGTPGSWVPLPPIGKPVANTFIYILDEKLKPVAHGETGEIYIGGDALAQGYINKKELTEERFLASPFEKGKRIYKTGDLGNYLPDGNIEYSGRADNQVKIRGYRIEPGEIEVVLGKLKGISQCAVTVREDEPGDKRLIAYYVAENKSVIGVSDIRNFLQGKLPEYMMPSAFVKIDEMPRTPSGKIDRKSLPAPDNSRPDIGTQFVAPKSNDEKLIAGIWSQLLRINGIGVNDNFFDLGGNSLLALQFIAKMRQEHNRDIPVVTLYRFPTTRGLLDSLNAKQEKQSLYEQAQQRFSKAGSGNQTGSASVEDGIAIIGMAGRFPGASGVDEFWKNLKEGKESVSFFSDSEIDPSIDPSRRNDPAYVKARGVIADVDKFDAAFFQVNPRLAELMDPQQRVFLEVCWEGLEHAGYSPSGYTGITGVFAGMGNNTYYQNNVVYHQDSIDKVGSFQVMVANEKDYIATRVSHLLNLKGPGLSIHTACSTSLTSVAMACQALWNHQCDMAVSGGIAVTSPVNSGHIYQEGGMFSSDGHTRSFDSNATGTVFSDGAGVVILKRYRDAVADGDTIYAVLRGTGVNNDGSDKASFTAPSVEGQAKAIAMAHAGAGVQPETITYVETHGTATPLGDPIEIEALSLAFGEHNVKQYCAIGSVKSNIGHLTAAAGVAGLIKTALALYHKVLPPSINYKSPNPAIDFKNSPFVVNNELTAWKAGKTPRRAGVSSFGVGGTNVHVVLEEAPEQIPSGPHRSRHLFTVSARTQEGISTAVKRLHQYFNQNREINLADAAYTLQRGRVSFAERKFFVAGDLSSALQQLEKPDPLKSGSNSLQIPADGVAFMFPGQGSQYVHMGSNLYRDEIVFREAVDRCAELLIPHMGSDIRNVIFPEKKSETKAAAELQETGFTQPALFTIGYALARLWMSWGIQPSALIGHSIGEFAAACISGIMSLEDAAMLVANRGRLMQEQPPGSMLSVRLGASELEKIIDKSLSIAAINGSLLSVVSGETKAIEKLQKELEAKEIVCKKLFTSHAFHSPMMDPVIAPFKNLFKKIKLKKPAIPVVSTATSQWLTDKQATDPDYWAQHLRKPVRFAEGIQTLWQEHPGLVLLELGPRNTASTLARQQARDPKKQFAVPSLNNTAENDAEWESMLNAIGKLWIAGIEIDWNSFYALEKRKHIPLPGYPFEKKRHWVNPTATVAGVNTFHQYLPFANENGNNPNNNVLSSDNITPMNIPNRKDRIINELRNIMEDASGIELASADANASFMELGLDSLFLTQAALTLSKKYSTKITFRQLNEQFTTLDLLAAQIDSSLPADQTIAVPATPTMNIPASITPVPGSADANTLQWLITQQLQMMQQQLAMVNGMNISSAGPVQPPAPSLPVAGKAHAAEISENEQADLAKPFGAIARIEKSVQSELSADQKKWLELFVARYNKKTAQSKSYTQQHRAHLADPRVVTGFKPALKELIYQVVVNRSSGTRVWDIDGNEYVDVLNGFGSNFLGYGSEIIRKAAAQQMELGIELGPQHPLAGEVAKLICEFTGYDRAGFCNTGSEAVLGALRIARTVTGRSTVVCFNGSYHGINDEVIVRGTRKLKSYPAAAGIMPESVQNMLVLDYGTSESLEIIRKHADDLAAVLVEPIQSRRADYRPKEFLEEVRKITAASGSLLIFDEVITGFRLLPGGAQEFFGIRADLGTYGKVIGGGMPIGVIAGKKEYMDALDGGFWQFGDKSVPEAGVTYFAGTFVRHPLALAAAKAVLLHLKERGRSIYEKLNGNTERLVTSINTFAASVQAPFHLVSFGSLFKVKWDSEHPYDELLYLLLRDKGVHIYDGFPCFVTDAFTDADIDFVINTFKAAISELQQAGFLSAYSQNGNAINVPAASNGHNDKPPVPGARLGKDKDGKPAWFVADPDRPGKFKQVFVA